MKFVLFRCNKVIIQTYLVSENLINSRSVSNMNSNLLFIVLMSVV
jgi:hypothetical protein